MTTKCTHHWIIPSSSAAEVTGKCALCKATKKFSNQLIFTNAEVWYSTQAEISKARKRARKINGSMESYQDSYVEIEGR